MASMHSAVFPEVVIGNPHLRPWVPDNDLGNDGLWLHLRIVNLILMIKTQSLCEYVIDAREKTFALVSDLTDEEMLGPKLRIVNPPLWEIGHVAWFQEFWVLRHAAGLTPIYSEADSLYDSMAIPHDTRWDLPLLQREGSYL